MSKSASVVAINPVLISQSAAVTLVGVEYNLDNNDLCLGCGECVAGCAIS